MTAGRGGPNWVRALLGCAAVTAAALGTVLALALGPEARPARAALPCGLLNPCTTSTATETLPTLTATTITTATTTTKTTPTVASGKPPLVYPGKTYDGRSGNFSEALTVQVAKSGRALHGWVLQYTRGVCSDGGRYGGTDFSMKTVPVSARGTASETVRLKPGHAFWFTRTGKRVRGAERYTARFSFAGTTVTGTLRDSFSSAKLSCHSGAIHFTAHLDGTPQAPLRTDMVDTGVYRATGETVEVYDPWRAVTELKARYTLICPKVKAQHYTLTLFDRPLSFSGPQSGGSFGDYLHYSSRLTHGITAKETITVAGTVEAYLGRKTESYIADVNISGFINYFAADGTQINYGCQITGGRTAAGPKHVPIIDPDLATSALRSAAH